MASIALSALGLLACGSVHAESFRIVPSFAISETLTNNVNLAPSGSARGDLVTQLTPSFSVNETGTRATLTGTVSVPLLLYVNTGAENNTAYAQANLIGSVEAIEKFFFIEGAIDASPQYFTPFGAQPQGLANATQNRYQSSLYRISPYIKGGSPGDVEYVVRNDNIWSTLNGAPVSTSNSYTNQIVANVGRHATQLGWSLEYNYSSVKFNSQPALVTQLGRLRLDHSPDPQLKLSVSGGYEAEDYTLSSSNGPIYGIGGTWHPTDRTSVDAFWEHRFFGSSYLFNFNHRMPLSVWSAYASRNITSYPQQIGTLQAGVNISTLLNQLFLSSLPDPGATAGRRRSVHQQPRTAFNAVKPDQSLHAANHACDAGQRNGRAAGCAQQHFSYRLLPAAAAHFGGRQRPARGSRRVQRQYAGGGQPRLVAQPDALADTGRERQRFTHQKQRAGGVPGLQRDNAAGLCFGRPVDLAVAEYIDQRRRPLPGPARRFQQ